MCATFADKFRQNFLENSGFLKSPLGVHSWKNREDCRTISCQHFLALTDLLIMQLPSTSSYTRIMHIRETEATKPHLAWVVHTT